MATGNINESLTLLAKFLPDKAGLTTVGYTLYNPVDGTIIQARTTTGVVGLGHGAYCVSIIRSSALKGVVRWDTGEATPEYAYEDIFISDIMPVTKAAVDALQVDLGDPSAEATTILAKVKDLDKGSGTVARKLSQMGTDYLAKLNGVALSGVTVKAYLKTNLNNIKGQITTDATGDGTFYLISGQTYVLYYEYQGSVMTKEYTMP